MTRHVLDAGSAFPACEAGEPKPPQAAEGSASEAAKGAPHCGPSGQALGSLEVECREALRTQWLSFPFDSEATAASTLAHCRAAASMASLNTLAVWPDSFELDFSLTLEVSLRPTERRLLASGSADASVAAQEDRAEPSFEGKPITTPDGLTAAWVSRAGGAAVVLPPSAVWAASSAALPAGTCKALLLWRQLV